MSTDLAFILMPSLALVQGLLIIEGKGSRYIYSYYHFFSLIPSEKLPSNAKTKRKIKRNEQFPVLRNNSSQVESEQEACSDEEALYERIPRPTTSWESRDGVKGAHYLLPLKSDRGRLIQQQPTFIGLLCREKSIFNGV